MLLDMSEEVNDPAPQNPNFPRDDVVEDEEPEDDEYVEIEEPVKTDET